MIGQALHPFDVPSIDLDLEPATVGVRVEPPVPLPEAGATASVTAEHITALRRDGYVVVENMSTPEELATLQVLYDRLFAESRGWETGHLVDFVSAEDARDGASLPQMFWPSRQEPALARSQLNANARSVAKQILGPAAQMTLEHAFMKPARRGAATPWHQDDAFGHRATCFPESMSIWIALQDVTVENGCLWYIPGSHRWPLAPHRSPGGDPHVHGLEATPPDVHLAKPVPLKAGDAVIHLSRTFHSAGPNTTDQPRRSYTCAFGVEVRRRTLFVRDHPWNLEKHTARERRALEGKPAWKRAARSVLKGLEFLKFL